MENQNQNHNQLFDPMGLGESPSSKDPSLFQGDSVALLSAKNLVLEPLFAILTRDLKFPDFMREILAIAASVVKSEAGSILEVNHKDQTLFFRATSGLSSADITQFTVHMGQGIAGYVAESRQSIVITNAKENQRHLKSIATAVGLDCRNLLAAPIVIRGRIFGVLELLNRVGEDNYSPTDLELISYFCDKAAQAIEIRLMLNWAKNIAENPASGEAA